MVHLDARIMRPRHWIELGLILEPRGEHDMAVWVIGVSVRGKERSLHQSGIPEHMEHNMLL